MSTMNYDMYLKSPEWEDRCRKRYDFDGGKCVGCDKKIAFYERNTHHLTYRHLFNEPIGDIVTLCRTCHQAYHRIDALRENIERMERPVVDIEAIRAENERLMKEREENVKRLTEDTIKAYADKDYAKDGSLDMCDWTVIKNAVETVRKAGDYGDVETANTSKIRNYFHCRRLEFLKRCIEGGFTIKNICDKTMLTWQFVNKWYSIEKIDKRLEQEKFEKQMEEK